MEYIVCCEGFPVRFSPYGWTLVERARATRFWCRRGWMHRLDRAALTDWISKLLLRGELRGAISVERV